MNKKILIVLSNYYKDIGNSLLEEAKKILDKNSINYNVLLAPGSFEIPFIINKNIKKYDGFIALGCIIKGETYHFNIIANECSRKIMDISIYHNKPIGFGILTCINMEQALKRCEPNKKNKGYEAALACIKLLN